MVDLKLSLNISNVGGVDIFGNTTELELSNIFGNTTELSNIYGNTTELSNGTNSFEANISLELKEPFVIQNGKVSNEQVLTCISK